MIAARQIDYFTDVEKSLLRAILYFDIFDYPITAQEALVFSSTRINPFLLEHSLEKLVNDKLIFRFGNFYSIQNIQQLEVNRMQGNALAKKRMKAARTYSKLIACFPFVRAVLLSGSISKGFMDAKSDIDYFIITAKNRLWIVRLALAVFRRIFLLNSHRNLCTNYFIDTDNLSIPDQNIFTATELTTLKGTYGREVIQQFQEANLWVFSFLPQANFDELVFSDKRMPFKNAIEKLLSLSRMDDFNRWLMKKSKAFWAKKYSQQVTTRDFDIAFRTKTGVSKSHPRFFQKRALDQLQTKIQYFESQHGIDLSL